MLCDVFPPSVVMQSLHGIRFSFINEEENEFMQLVQCVVTAKGQIRIRAQSLFLPLVWYIICVSWSPFTLRSSFMRLCQLKGFVSLKREGIVGVEIVGFVLSL